MKRQPLDIHPKVKVPAKVSSLIALVLIVLSILAVVPATAAVAATGTTVLMTALGYVTIGD